MILLYISFLAILLWIVWKLPKWQTGKDIKASERWKAENEFRKTIIQLIGGILIILSLLSTWKKMDQTQKNFEKSQQIDLFNRAIQLIGESDYTQKVGGIYTLEGIAKESPEAYLETSIDILSALVRNAEYVIKVAETVKEQNNDKEKEKFIIKPEILITCQVLGKIRKRERDKLIKIDLVRAKLREADLRSSQFWSTDFEGADLEMANLQKTDLQGANLSGANCSYVNFAEANLQNVNFRGTYLVGANLSNTDLEGTNINEAIFITEIITSLMTGERKSTNPPPTIKNVNLNSVNFSKKLLIGVDFSGSDLEGADLKGADLTGANLQGTNLTKADLTEAELSGANLSYAILESVKGLTTEQLSFAGTLYMVKGLDPKIEAELKEEDPDLFEKPDEESKEDDFFLIGNTLAYLRKAGTGKNAILRGDAFTGRRNEKRRGQVSSGCPRTIFKENKIKPFLTVNFRNLP